MSESPLSPLASDQVGESPIVDLTWKIMVVVIIVLFMVVVVALGVHIYAKVFWWCRSSQSQSQSRPRSVTALGVGNGLDPSILTSLPTLIFQPLDSSKDGLECSVCLSELVEGEKLRLLPKCNHGFHVGCIDMWFHSHATCPLCRTIVVASQSEDSQSFPTNVLIWGNQTQITTTSSSSSSATAASLEESTSNNTTKTNRRHDGMLVIDILGHGEEETPSSSSPVLRRLRSLRRILSNNKLNSWSPTSTETKGEEGHN